MLVYLDDWLFQAPSWVECTQAVELMLSTCANLGLAVNVPKSQLIPYQHLQWLGMVWDSQSTTLALSQDNVSRILAQLFWALHALTVSH